MSSPINPSFKTDLIITEGIENHVVLKKKQKQAKTMNT